ncbi:MAG: ATP synthase F1 subunit epsilon [Cyclobacteriaceae bacterium]|nr:ATP synthase F1 subunit epsilon [Cyclobacteriaceae bacterium]
MLLEIYTPDKKVFEGQVDSATFPGSKGNFQVLNNHAALISTLEKGKVVYRIKNDIHEILILGGVVEVKNNKVVLLAEGIADNQ